jgi:hypothetical protein
MTFSPFRRTFLGSLPAAFAGLFGLGRSKAMASEKSPPTLNGYVGQLPRLVPEQVREELARLRAALLDPSISPDRYQQCYAAQQALAWAIESSITLSPCKAIAEGRIGRGPNAPPGSEAYEYRVVTNFADGTGGTSNFHAFCPAAEKDAKASFEFDKEMLSGRRGTVELQRAALGAWETVERVQT